MLKNSNGLVSIFILTQNKLLKLGLESVIEEAFSKCDRDNVSYNIYDIKSLNDLTIKMLRTGGKSIVFFDSDGFFFHDRLEMVNKINDTNLQFESVFLCDGAEYNKMSHFYNLLFKTVLNKSIPLRHIKMDIEGVIIKMVGTRDFELRQDVLPEICTPFLRLTTREANVLKNIFKGKNTREIANNLYISEKTVLAHRSRIYSKFSVHSLSELYFFIRNSTHIKNL